MSEKASVARKEPTRTSPGNPRDQAAALPEAAGVLG